MKLGDIVAQKYKVIREIGRGGTSTVYLAENIAMGTYWTIKHIVKDCAVVVSAYNECQMLKKINYHTLPRIFDFIEEGENIYIVMDYAEGKTLKEIIEFSQHMDIECIVNLFIELTMTLRYLHGFDSGAIIYRDMKPANIIIMKDNRIRLIDFGSAREYKAGNVEDTIYIGTKGYAAPEQYGIGQSDQRTDIYSLGITMFQVITGVCPIKCKDVRSEVEAALQVNGDGLMKIIDKCTRNNSADRYEDAEELLKELYTYQSSLSKTKANFMWKGKDISRRFILGSLIRKKQHKPIVFKKQILVVLENLEFACELAYAIAIMSGTKVALVDMDTFGLSVETYLNAKAIGNFFEELRENEFTHINKYKYDSFQKIQLYIFGSVADHTNNLYKAKLRVRSAVLEDDGISKNLANIIYKSFDFTIINVSRQIDDKARKSFFAGCDSIIVPVKADIMDIRKRSIFMDFVYTNERPRVKMKYVLWQYQKEIHIPYTYIKDLLGKENIAGTVPFSRIRQEFRRYGKYKPEKLVNLQNEEYKKILKEIDIYSYSYN